MDHKPIRGQGQAAIGVVYIAGVVITGRRMRGFFTDYHPRASPAWAYVAGLAWPWYYGVAIAKGGS